MTKNMLDIIYDQITVVTRTVMLLSRAFYNYLKYFYSLTRINVLRLTYLSLTKHNPEDYKSNMSIKFS